MNKDIRLSISFLDHPETIKLKRSLGWEGVECLIRLWCWAAQNKPDGDLAGLNREYIALVSGWRKSPDVFIETLVELRFLDTTGFFYKLEDWGKKQPHLKIVAATKRPYSKAWKKIKTAIFHRDDFTCVYCGATPSQIECDHMIPISRGGDNSQSNLVTSCPTCNRKKATKTVDEWLGGGKW